MSAPISGVRIRLSFESPSSDSSLCDLPTNCWFLVRNNSQTISDIMAQLIHRFFSREKQPSVQLFLDNHVLPVWESVDILRENDSVTVTVRSPSSETSTPRQVLLATDGDDEICCADGVAVAGDSKDEPCRSSTIDCGHAVKKKKEKRNKSESGEQGMINESENNGNLSLDNGVAIAGKPKHKKSKKRKRNRGDEILPAANDVDECCTVKREDCEERGAVEPTRALVDVKRKDCEERGAVQPTRALVDVAPPVDVEAPAGASTTEAATTVEATSVEATGDAANATSPPRLVEQEPTPKKKRKRKRKRTSVSSRQRVESPPVKEDPFVCVVRPPPANGQSHTHFDSGSENADKEVETSRRFDDGLADATVTPSSTPNVLPVAELPEVVPDVDLRSSRRDDIPRSEDLRSALYGQQPGQVFTRRQKNDTTRQMLSPSPHESTDQHAAIEPSCDTVMVEPLPPPKDYSQFPLLDGPPRAYDKIAYKILEVSADYTPQVSSYKEALVLSYNAATQTVLLKMTDPPQPVRKEPGKFDMTVETDTEILTNEIQPNVDSMETLCWLSIIEPRLLS